MDWQQREQKSFRPRGVFMTLISLGLLCASPALSATPRAVCQGRPATIVGTAGEDIIQGTPYDDVIVALERRDQVFGKGGNDLICLGGGGRYNHQQAGDGGPGKDMVLGGPSYDRMVGNGGRDILVGGGGEDYLAGGAGSDLLRGRSGPDYLTGQNGNDRLQGGLQEDRLIGGPGDDDHAGGQGEDSAEYWRAASGLVVDLAKHKASGAGRDRLFSVEEIIGSDHDDILRGGQNDDTLHGEEGNDLLIGRSGNDCLDPGLNEDELRGGAGFDFYSSPIFQEGCEIYPDSSGYLLQGVDVDLEKGIAVRENKDPDIRGIATLKSIEGAFGSFYIDTLKGDEGENYLHGGPSDDSIEGRGGDDQLDGGTDNDAVNGGMGTDECLNGEVLALCES